MKIVINPTPAQEELAKTFGHIVIYCNNYVPIDLIARTLKMNRQKALEYLEVNYPEIVKEMSLKNYKEGINET